MVIWEKIYRFHITKGPRATRRPIKAGCQYERTIGYFFGIVSRQMPAESGRKQCPKRPPATNPIFLNLTPSSARPASGMPCCGSGPYATRTVECKLLNHRMFVKPRSRCDRIVRHGGDHPVEETPVPDFLLQYLAQSAISPRRFSKRSERK